MASKAFSAELLRKFPLEFSRSVADTLDTMPASHRERELTMTHLTGKPLGTTSRNRADVLREIIEQIDDPTNPLHSAAVVELAREVAQCAEHKSHHLVTDDLGRSYVVGINGDGSTGYAHDVEDELGEEDTYPATVCGNCLDGCDGTDVGVEYDPESGRRLCAACRSVPDFTAAHLAAERLSRSLDGAWVGVVELDGALAGRYAAKTFDPPPNARDLDTLQIRAWIVGGTL